MRLVRHVLATPVGPLHLTADDHALRGVGWRPSEAPAVATPRGHPVLAGAKRQLNEYFAGARDRFDLPIEIARGTGFQREVWRALATIPFGQTWSYAELARAVGRPRAARAVGAANRQNPIAVIIPCHRVIASGGGLGGFAGGLDAKRTLLALENSFALVAPRA